jgi:hypothetical protein
MDSHRFPVLKNDNPYDEADQSAVRPKTKLAIECL